MSNPDVPLGTAEQFLLTMSSINELAPRLHLWAFKLDYDQLERVRNLYDRNQGGFFSPHSMLGDNSSQTEVRCLIDFQEVAEPLMDLKESVQELHNNDTFKHILATLLAIGNFLNGKKVLNLNFM